MNYVVPICAFLFPALLIAMEAVFKAESGANWSFAGPALAATSVSILLASLKPSSHKKKEILKGRFEATLISEMNTLYVLVFIALIALAVWGWVIHEASINPVPELWLGIPRPLGISILMYTISQIIFMLKESKYA